MPQEPALLAVTGEEVQQQHFNNLLYALGLDAGGAAGKYREAETLNTATATLTVADSGKTFVFDRAAGVAVTLPALGASDYSVFYQFFVKTSVTSNAYSVTAGATSDLFIGQIVNYDTDTSNAVSLAFVPDNSNDDAMSMNGTTTGGLAGTNFTFQWIPDAERWLVLGTVLGSGVVATPFS